MRLKPLLSFALCFLLFGNANAGTKCEQSFVEVVASSASRFQFSHARIEGRAVYFEHLPAKRGKTTFFVLNGMFVPSGDLQAFREVFEAKSKGEGLLIMFYSTQLESLYLRGVLGSDPALNLMSAESSKSAESELRLKDLVDEAKAVLRQAAVRGSVIPVGYSFGSAPAVALASETPSAFRRLVLFSPYVYAGEQLPFGAGDVESLLRMNPFLGEAAVNKLRAQSARTTAAASIDDYILKMGGLPDGLNRETAITGLMSQILSVIDFDLRKVNPPAEIPIDFVLAENEGTLRFIAQQSAAKSLSASRVIVVPQASHHLMALQPEAAVDALLQTNTSSR